MSKKIFYLIFIPVLILAVLNIQKFFFHRFEVVPVWSSFEEEYYFQEENSNILSRLRSYLSVENIVYQLTKVRLKAPLSYLKREIPLLAYYTPEELREPQETVYSSDFAQNKVIELRFDLGEERRSEEKLVSPRIQPVVAIYHTHTSETYFDDPRRQDNNGHVIPPGSIGNIAKVGQELAQVLANNYGFKVIHTTKVHDESYSHSYYNSRQTVKEILEQNERIDLLLDLHRDGNQFVSRETVTTMVQGERVAKIMIVVTNGKFEFAHLENTDNHPRWEENLTLANKLAAKMEEMYPGLLYKIIVRDTRYNQDLHPGALLLEIGDYQNSTQEALRSARLLADVIANLLYSP